jgi:hypothetical protein
VCVCVQGRSWGEGGGSGVPARQKLLTRNNTYFRRSWNFRLFNLNKRQVSTWLWLLKFVISVMGGHCNYSPPAPNTLARPLRVRVRVCVSKRYNTEHCHWPVTLTYAPRGQRFNAPATLPALWTNRGSVKRLCAAHPSPSLLYHGRGNNYQATQHLASFSLFRLDPISQRD